MMTESMTEAARRDLAAAFQGTFLLRRRCRCTIYVTEPGQGRKPLCWAVPCSRCIRYAWITDPSKAASTYRDLAEKIRILRTTLV
jgi:hypothetical protein